MTGSGRPNAGPGAQHVRENCYALLYSLLSDEKNLDKLLVIKMETTELRQLVKAIATSSADGVRRMEAYAAADPSIHLKDERLPPGEMATRAAIAKTKTKLLVKPFDKNFEFNLLLTQTEALSYAWHLARVAAAHENNPDRARGLTSFSETMQTLHNRTVSLLRVRADQSSPPK